MHAAFHAMLDPMGDGRLTNESGAAFANLVRAARHATFDEFDALIREPEHDEMLYVFVATGDTVQWNTRRHVGGGGQSRVAQGRADGAPQGVARRVRALRRAAHVHAARSLMDD